MENIDNLSAEKNKPIHITADYRENRSDVVTHLGSMKNVVLTSEKLEVGDYEVSGKFIFERKTLTDFVISIIDGRLFRQAYLLSDSALSPVMILEGSTKDIAGLRMKRESIQGALIYISIGLQIPVLRSLSGEESARLMLYTANQFSPLPRVALKRGKPLKTKRSRQIQILQGLPGVGVDRAERLLKEFGSVAAVFQAEIEDLVAVPGVGDKTAKAIHWAIKEEITVYGEKEESAISDL